MPRQEAGLRPFLFYSWPLANRSHQSSSISRSPGGSV